MLWTDLELVWCGSVTAGTNSFHLKSFVRTQHSKVQSISIFSLSLSNLASLLVLLGRLLVAFDWNHVKFFGCQSPGAVESLLWFTRLWRPPVKDCSYFIWFLGALFFFFFEGEVFKPLQWLELPGCDLLSKLAAPVLTATSVSFLAQAPFLSSDLSLSLREWFYTLCLNLCGGVKGEDLNVSPPPPPSSFSVLVNLLIPFFFPHCLWLRHGQHLHR